MPVGTVQKVDRTKNGAEYIAIDGVWYFTSKCETKERPSPGQQIEYVSNPFGQADNKGRYPQGLQKWRPVVNSNGQPATAAIPKSAAVDDASLRFISNVVGSAITAGAIKGPTEVGPWSIAALRALKSLEVAQQLKDVLEQPKPEFDDSAQLNEEIPDSFYEGLPPQKAPGKNW